MKARRNLLAGILVLIVSLFLIYDTGRAAQGDCKQTPWHKLLADVDRAPDKAARKRIFKECSGPREMAQKDRDAWFNALSSKHKDVQLEAVRIARAIKDERSIKKLVDIVRQTDSKAFTRPMVEKMTDDQLKELTEDVMTETVYILGSWKNEEALPVIVEKLGDITQSDTMNDIVFRNVLLKNYGAMSLRHIEKRIEKFGDNQTTGKYYLLSVISDMRGNEAMPELRRLTASSNPEIRAAAFKSLGAMKEKGDVTQIFADIDAAHAKYEEFHEKRKGKRYSSSSEMEESIRLKSIEDKLYRGLAESKNTDALPILIQRVEAVRVKDKYDFDNKVYMELLTIRDIGGPDAFAYMKKVYEEIPTKVYRFGDRKGKKNVERKNSFLGYFGKKGFVEAVPFLESIMNDTNEERILRRTAARGLIEITNNMEYYRKYNEIEEGKR